MMEKFFEDADEYERRHDEAWHGRTFGAAGTGTGMALEPLSPTGFYDFAQNPGLFNLMKMGYLPALNYGAFTFAGWVFGEKFTFTHRLLHSVDMTYRTYKWGFQAAGTTAARAFSPIAAGAAWLGTVFAADALLGWFNPNLGILPDADFMRWTQYG